MTDLLPQLAPFAWALLGAAAVLVGISKTAIPGINTIGTAAWFFAVINLVKAPIVLGLGLVNGQTLLLVLVLVPGVAVGAFIGRWIASRIRQRAFEWAVIVCTVLGAIYLLI